MPTTSCKPRLTKRRAVTILRRLWRDHDKLERQILLIERHFTDKELKRIGAAAGPR